MIPYSALAQVYDQLTGDVAYRQWAEFAQRAFERQGKGETKVILELACGTGSLTQLLAQAGYEMIAADISPEMLSVAREKCASAPCPPIFLCQDMRELDLYGDIDAAVCCLDSVNYLTGLRDLKRAFRRVALFLRPGGLFLFDVKTPLPRWAASPAFSRLERLFALGNMAMRPKAAPPSTRWISFGPKPTAGICAAPSSMNSGPIAASSWSRRWPKLGWNWFLSTPRPRAARRALRPAGSILRPGKRRGKRAHGKSQAAAGGRSLSQESRCDNFLPCNPAGQGTSENVLSVSDPRTAEFFARVDASHPFQVGLDAYNAPSVLPPAGSVPGRLPADAGDCLLR